MITKTVEVTVDISTDELVREIKSRGAKDTVWIFKAITETPTDEELMQLLDFVGVDNMEKFAAMASSFAQRIRKAAAAAGGE